MFLFSLSFPFRFFYSSFFPVIYPINYKLYHKTTVYLFSHQWFWSLLQPVNTGGKHNLKHTQIQFFFSNSDSLWLSGRFLNSIFDIYCKWPTGVAAASAHPPTPPPPSPEVSEVGFLKTHTWGFRRTHPVTSVSSSRRRKRSRRRSEQEQERRELLPGGLPLPLSSERRRKKYTTKTN